eukprot:scaffold742_cov165-Amphora_coffeaeformis.AAC.25
MSLALPQNNTSAIGAIVGGYIVATTTAVLAYWYLQWRRSPLRRIPGPRQSFWWGSFLEIQKEPFMEPHKKWCQSKETAGYENPVLVYSYMLGSDALLVLDKMIVRTILSNSKEQRFHKGSLAFLESRLGQNGLLTLNGDAWKRHRRILTPSFQTHFLHERLEEEVPRLVSRLVEDWTRAGRRREIDVGSHLSALTVDIVGKVLFSHNFNGVEAITEWALFSSQSSDETSSQEATIATLNDPFLTALRDAIQPSILSFLLIGLNLQELDAYINPDAWKTRRNLDQAAELILARAQETEKHSKSLLHLLLQAEDPETRDANLRRLNRQELRDEIKTFLMAGHETTATWLYWCLFALAKNPTVQERLYKDVMIHAKNDKSEAIDLEQTGRMGYLQAFLQEVLRLYPPAGIIFRYASYPEEFAGYKIPTNTRCVISIHLLERHPKYWDDPETFRPERWINVSAEEQERRKFAFLPFSAGARNCIGQRFATLEAQLILAPLVRAFQIFIAPSQKDTNHTFTAFGTMKAKPDLRIVVQSRD